MVSKKEKNNAKYFKVNHYYTARYHPPFNLNLEPTSPSPNGGEGEGGGDGPRRVIKRLSCHHPSWWIARDDERES